MNKVEICIKKILFYIIFLMAVLIIPTMFVKAESNKKSPKTIESFKIDNTKGECDFTYNLEDAADWMENITGIKKNEQTIPVSKYTISMESATITIGITLSENDKISISSEGYQDIAFVIQGEHLFNTAWKHDENTHWKECMIKDCVEKTDIAEHSGGQATCQKKAECEVCSQEYGEFGAHNYGSEWKHDATSHWRECQTKGCTAQTDVAKHSGGQATYQKKAICSVCKISYGEVKKEDKKVVIETLTEQVNSYKHLYVSDISGLDAVDTQALRRACFDANIKLVQVKNTLLKKALENATNNYEEIFSALKGDSAIMLCDTGNGPAKLIKEFRKTKDKPVFKAAFVEECAYVGEDQLESLISIKSKEELLADIIAMLQAPMQNVISALQSGQNTIAGVVKTLSEKE